MSKYERSIMKKICKQGLPVKFRRQIWLKATGAGAIMTLPENKMYYRRLKHLKLSYPNPSFS